MLDELRIKSFSGEYNLKVYQNVFAELSLLPLESSQFIVDELVYNLYKDQFQFYLSERKLILIKAIEKNKNIDEMSSYAYQLMDNGIKIDHTLIAIGGGVIQDIVCFLSTTLFRGMKWDFVPTTLLAQADSCIGSKSSVNVGKFKNLMGTFYPPRRILVDIKFLNTLKRTELLSGFGEILKVHMIRGVKEFERAASSYDRWFENNDLLLRFIYDSLLFKKYLIELDEYDKGPRNVMNYGHTYGHAIESASNFEIPHGVAVSMGMDMANFQSLRMKRISEKDFLSWHDFLFKNYRDFLHVKIGFDAFLNSISKDKKNLGHDLSLILVRDEGPIEKVRVPLDDIFKKNCLDFINQYLI